MDYHIPTKYKCSPEAIKLVARMLQKDPTQRITISELYNDPWFRKDFPDSVCSAFYYFSRKMHIFSLVNVKPC